MYLNSILHFHIPIANLIIIGLFSDYFFPFVLFCFAIINVPRETINRLASI